MQQQGGERGMESMMRGRGGGGGGRGSVSFIAQTTGVSLIPCFVGSDEEMRFFFPFLLPLCLASRTPAHSLDFSPF